jgi:hypothetical protein
MLRLSFPIMLRRCLLVICVLLIAAEAHATTLEITSGSIFSSSSTFGTTWTFQGPGFGVSGGLAFFVLFGPFGPCHFVDDRCSLNIDLNIGQVDFVNGVVCNQQVGILCAGSLSLTGNFSSAFAPGPLSVTVPFTATGQILQGFFGSPEVTSFDLVGRGFVPITKPEGAAADSTPDSTFVFVSPEPSSLVLLFIGVFALPLLRLRTNSKRSNAKMECAP